jgi:hypothetical protein
MATQSIALSETEAVRRPLMGELHQWVITVDHKRIGLLYIFYGLLFLVIAGVEATVMRIQLIRPLNNFVSPEVFNRMFTMHGTTMIFFVAMPLVFGFANYLIPPAVGARDMAFPRLNAFSFWMTAFGGLLLYFSFVGGDGLYGAGNAPDVGWFAYTPLTSQTFSPGHSTDFWTLSLLVSGFGSIGTATNIIATIVCMRCKGMTLGKMPLLAWLNLTMGGLVIMVIGPLTAAQLMLLVDRYLGGHFFDTQAGGSAVMWMHFFWVFGHPEVYVLVIPAFSFVSEIVPVFSRKAIFGYPIMVGATVGIGFISMSVWAHHMFTVGMSSAGNTFFVLSTMAIAVPTGIKIFNWLATMWGGHIHFRVPMLFCIGFLFQFLCAGLTGVMLAAAPFRLATHRVVLCGRALSLRDRGRHSLWNLRRFLLLVPENVRPNVQRETRPTAFLAFHNRIPSDFRFHAHSRPSRNAPPHLHLRAGARLGHLESHRHHRCILSSRRCPGFCRQPALVLLPRCSRGERSLGCVDPRVVHQFAASLVQLRQRSGGQEPPPAMGPETSGRPRLALRVTS